ncbi:hypothetical protein J6590_047352 [Homalodisca vitripennis]|nr:hypothetical protein J6590_047352 [Homalodisca vitripennis]
MQRLETNKNMQTTVLPNDDCMFAPSMPYVVRCRYVAERTLTPTTSLPDLLPTTTTTTIVRVVLQPRGHEWTVTSQLTAAPPPLPKLTAPLVLVLAKVRALVYWVKQGHVDAVRGSEFSRLSTHNAAMVGNAHLIRMLGSEIALNLKGHYKAKGSHISPIDTLMTSFSHYSINNRENSRKTYGNSRTMIYTSIIWYRRLDIWELNTLRIYKSVTKSVEYPRHHDTHEYRLDTDAWIYGNSTLSVFTRVLRRVLSTHDTMIHTSIVWIPTLGYMGTQHSPYLQECYEEC